MRERATLKIPKSAQIRLDKLIAESRAKDERNKRKDAAESPPPGSAVEGLKTAASADAYITALRSEFTGVERHYRLGLHKAIAKWFADAKDPLDLSDAPSAAARGGNTAIVQRACHHPQRRRLRCPYFGDDRQEVLCSIVGSVGAHGPAFCVASDLNTKIFRSSKLDAPRFRSLQSRACPL